ncbi:MAG: CBS domain-containing protein [Saprospiraceae bacterium]|jgi:Mg/Co/Ni transporter MgtE
MFADARIVSIMTRNPETVNPQNNMEVVRTIFEKFGFHHIPVVEEGQLVGLVSYTDYLRIIRDLFNNPMEESANNTILKSLLVREVMTENLLCLNESDTVRDAMRVFKTNHFHSLPVIGDDGKLLGIVTTYDVLKVLEGVFALENG